MEAAYARGWTYSDVLEAPLRELLRCRIVEAKEQTQDTQLQLLVVNTIRAALGGDPIDLFDQSPGQSKTNEEEAKALAERFQQIQQTQ